MKLEVIHTKRLTSSQFDATKGSNIHSVMVMNRVIIDFKIKLKRSDIEDCAYNFTEIENYLLTSCQNYYFISDKPMNERSLCYYFLSKADMEEFIVWARLALPKRDPDRG